MIIMCSSYVCSYIVTMRKHDKNNHIKWNMEYAIILTFHMYLMCIVDY